MHLKIKIGATFLVAASTLLPIFGSQRVADAQSIGEIYGEATRVANYYFSNGKKLTQFATRMPDGWNVFIENNNDDVVYQGTNWITHTVEYDGAIIVAMSNGHIYRDGLYRNPPMLTGGGYLYSGKYRVQDMRSCNDGVYTLFTNGVWYQSRDGQNLGGGGRTIRVSRPAC